MADLSRAALLTDGKVTFEFEGLGLRSRITTVISGLVCNKVLGQVSLRMLAVRRAFEITAQMASCGIHTGWLAKSPPAEFPLLLSSRPRESHEAASLRRVIPAFFEAEH